MPLLDIHLQEGFAGENVVVSIDGEEQLQRDEVHTRRAIGLAEHVKFDVAEGPHTIVVRIPAHEIEKQLDVVVNERLFIGLGLANGELRVRIREKQFGYG